MESPEVVNFPPPRSLTQSQLLYNRQHIIDLLSKGKLGDHFHGVSNIVIHIDFMHFIFKTLLLHHCR